MGQSVLLAPDSTTNSLVTQSSKDYQVIQGGMNVGENLFHSFRAFSVPDQSIVEFRSPPAVRNIVVRVSGPHKTHIDGTLKHQGHADIFLLNPNGLHFGENAGLDINGSFLATTANSFIFDSQVKFEEKSSKKAPLLAVKAPVGLEFLHDQPAGIHVTSGQPNISFDPFLLAGHLPHSANGGLRVSAQQQLALIGGPLNIDGAYIASFGGDIELASISSKGQVSFTTMPIQWHFDYQNIEGFGEINVGSDLLIPPEDTLITSTSLTDPSGRIHLQGSLIRLSTQKRKDLVTTAFPFFSAPAFTNTIIDISNRSVLPGGKLTIDATDEFQINDQPTRLNPFPVGNGVRSGLLALTSHGSLGGIQVNSPKVKLNGDFARITSRTIQGFNTGGKSAAIDINAKESIRLEDRARIDSSTFTNGDAGAITLHTKTLSLLDAGAISSFTTNLGRSGDISIYASEKVELSGSIPFFGFKRPSEIRLTAGGFLSPDRLSGDAGELTISTRNLEVTRSGQLQLDSAVDGNVGAMILNVENVIVSEGGQILLDANNEGNVGSLSLSGWNGQDFAKNVLISGDGELGVDGNPSGIYATSIAHGNSRGSNILIQSQDINIIDSGQIAFGIIDGNSKDSIPGNLNIRAHRLTLKNARLGAPSFFEFSQEKPLSSGQIRLNVDFLDLKHSSISASTFLDDISGGTIALSGLSQPRLKSLKLLNSSQLLAETLSNASGGTVSIAAEEILVDQGSRVSVSNQPLDSQDLLGDPGSISIFDSSRLFLGRSSALTAENHQHNQLSSSVGNIQVELDQLLMLDGGRISTNAPALSTGGNIRLDTPVLLSVPQRNSDIVANAQFGQGGIITIQADAGIFGFQLEEANRLSNLELELNSDNDLTSFSSASSPINILISSDAIDSISDIPISEYQIDPLPNVCYGKEDIAESSSFVQVGQGGITQAPTLDFWEDNRNLQPISPEIQTNLEDYSRSNFIEAQGWLRSSQGHIELLANNSLTDFIAVVPSSICSN